MPGRNDEPLVADQQPAASLSQAASARPRARIEAPTCAAVRGRQLPARGEARGQGRADHRGGFRHRSRGRRDLCARGAEVAIAYLPGTSRIGCDARRSARIPACRLLPGDLRRAILRRIVERPRRVREARHPGFECRSSEPQEKLAEVTDEEFDRTFETNVYAYFRLVRAALRICGAAG